MRLLRILKKFKILGLLGLIFTLKEWCDEAERLRQEEKLANMIKHEGGSLEGQGN